MEEALEVALREADNGYRNQALAIIHHALGDTAKSNESLRTLITTSAADAAIQISEAYAARGELDEAFAWLDRAYVQRDAGLAEVKLSRLLRPLHGDPRWDTFLKKMNFEE